MQHEDLDDRIRVFAKLYGLGYIADESDGRGRRVLLVSRPRLRNIHQVIAGTYLPRVEEHFVPSPVVRPQE